MASGKLIAPAQGWDLQGYAAACDFVLTPEALVGLTKWLDELCLWNQRLDLTAARTAGELVDLMVRDAIELAKVVPPGASVVDVGTGAGGPGLALGLMRPDLTCTLVEPLAKRTGFMRTVLASLGRLDISVRRAKGEDLLARGERFTFAVSRATLAPARWLQMGCALVDAPGDAPGTVAVLLAQEAPPLMSVASTPGEVSTDGSSALRPTCVTYTWLRSAGARTLALYRVGNGPRA